MSTSRARRHDRTGSASGSTIGLAGLRRFTAIATAAALLGGSLVAAGTASAAIASAPGGGHAAGSYLVTLADAPASQYTGGQAGYGATAPASGTQLDAASGAVSSYSHHLVAAQKQLAVSVGARVSQSFSLTLDAFTATLSASQADRLAALPAVAGLSPIGAIANDATDASDAVVTPAKPAARTAAQLEPSSSGAKGAAPQSDDDAGDGPSGTAQPWTGIDVRIPELFDEQFGGDFTQAGAGIVIGVIGSGISTENLALTGEPLVDGDASDAAPHLDGGDVVFDKADGGEFRGECETDGPGEDASSWNANDCNTKVIGARYFTDGFDGTKADLEAGDYRSPRDAMGVGTHSASVAAAGAHAPAEQDTVGWGQFTGVAPGAKIASYKACWGSIYDESTSGICINTDMVAAIEQAVADGVDVLDMSTFGHYDDFFDPAFRPVDQALRGAAAAGVFIAAPAGDQSTGTGYIVSLPGMKAQQAQPYYTLVGASETPGTRATVTTGGHVVEGDTTVLTAPLTAPVVMASDARLNGYDPDSAALCAPGSLSPTAAHGKIVVCDVSWDFDVSQTIRQQAQEVSDVGGVGMIVVVDESDEFSAPVSGRGAVPVVVVHVDDLAPITAAAAAGGSVTLAPEDPAVTAGQAAYFNLSGPVDERTGILAPDVLAPGTLYRGAWASVRSGDGFAPTDATMSGTDVAAAYVAGLAAVYLGTHPDATPMTVKSALMTTAKPVAGFEGAPLDSPFEGGAGEVDPLAVLDAGLSYESDTDDWSDYLHSQGLVDDGDPDAQPWQLNQPAIVLDDTSGGREVTRTVTSIAPGHYTVSFDPIPGLDIAVSPSTLDFTAAGQSKSYTVTVSGAPAAFDHYLGTRIRWTDDAGTVSSLPLLYSAKSSTTPTLESGSGVDGSTDFGIVNGAGGVPQLSSYGAAPLITFPNNGTAHDPSHSGGVKVRDGAKTDTEVFEVPAGTRLLHVDAQMFALPQVGASSASIDYVVLHVGDPIGSDNWGALYGEMESDYTDNARKTVDWVDPDPGTYVIYLFPQGEQDFDLSYATLGAAGAGGTASTGTVTATASKPTGADPDGASTIHLAWSDLEARSRYIAAVGYSDAAAPTVVDIATGPGRPLSSTAPPEISGAPVTDAILTATPGTWSAPAVDTAYQWLRNGAAIPGATDSSYRVVPSDVGAALSATVTASKHAYQLATATTAPVTVGAATLAATAPPLVTGTPAVGEVLNASAGAWNADPASIAYQWSIDGTPVSGENAAAFTVPFEAAGHAVTVTATASRPGYTDGGASSAPVSVVGLAVRNLVKPKISGSAVVGATLRASAGVWDVRIPVTYRWLVNGKPLAGATKATLKVAASMAGKKVSFVATAAGEGYAAASAASASVTVKRPATVTVKFGSRTVKGAKKLVATVTVTVKGVKTKPAGKVSVKIAGRTLSAKLKAGKAQLVFPSPHGRTTAVAKYAGSTTVAPAATTAKTPAR